MIIPVHTHGEKLKYMLIELQGTLRSADQDTLDGQSVGTISVREGKPFIVIGHHELEGKVQKLKAPLAVMQKLPSSSSVPAQFTPVSPSTAGAPASQPDAAGAGVPPTPAFSIVGYVHEKVIFESRPLPIVRGGESSLSKRARLLL